MAALVTIQNSRNRAGDIRGTTWPIWRRPWWWLGGMVVGQVGRLDAKMERTHRQFLFPRNPYMDFSPCVENFQMHCGFGNKFGRKCRSSENFTPPLFAPAHYPALPVVSLPGEFLCVTYPISVQSSRPAKAVFYRETFTTIALFMSSLVTIYTMMRLS